MTKRDAKLTEYKCPSAQPGMRDAVVFGVVDHSADPPEVGYLDELAPVSEELLRLAEPLVPTEVFRIGATCEQDRCGHWGDSKCNLVEQIVDLVPASALVIPPCRLRPTCRWYAQRGRSACMRCDEVVTQNQRPSDAMRAAATPLGVRRDEQSQ